jgi:hypothetical protein
MSGTAGGPRHEALQQAAVSPLTPEGTPVQNLSFTPNFVLGLQVLLAEQALPAAGAFVNANATVPIGTKRVTFWITYTRGAAGGYPAIRISTRVSSVQDFHRVIILDLSSFAASGPIGIENFYVEELLGPAPGDGNPLRYELTIVMPANAQEFEFQIAERGVTLTPGTVSVGWSGDG